MFTNHNDELEFHGCQLIIVRHFCIFWRPVIVCKLHVTGIRVASPEVECIPDSISTVAKPTQSHIHSKKKTCTNTTYFTFQCQYFLHGHFKIVPPCPVHTTKCATAAALKELDILKLYLTHNDIWLCITYHA